MGDVVFIGLALALFALSGWYVAGCERLIGGEDRGRESAGRTDDRR